MMEMATRYGKMTQADQHPQLAPPLQVQEQRSRYDTVCLVVLFLVISEYRMRTMPENLPFGTGL